MATCLALAWADGLRAGNRLEALPPGLKLGDATPAGTVDGFEVIPTGVAVALTAMVADATASVGRLAALAVADRLTEETVVAVRGRVNCARSCRCADAASTVPRLHDAVPSPLPQPRLNCGVPPLVGAVFSWSTALGTLPPVAQAATVHWVTCPRALLCRTGWTSTHRLAGAVLAEAVLAGAVLAGAVLAAARTPLSAAAPAAATCPTRAAVNTSECPAELPDAMLPASALVVEAVLVVDVDVGIAVVGAAVVGAAVVGAAVVGAAVVAAAVAGAAVVPVDVGVAVVAVAVGVAVVAVGDGLVDAAAALRGSHDSPLAAAAAAAGDAAMPAMRPHEEAASRAPPAATLTVLRRAKPMKPPYSYWSVPPGNDPFNQEPRAWHDSSGLPCYGTLRHAKRSY